MVYYLAMTNTITDWATGEDVAVTALNKHLGMTVREILNLGYCTCGHEADSHFEDGLLEAPTACADLGWDHQGCLCPGFRGASGWMDDYC